MVAWSSGRLDVVAATTKGTVQHWWWSGSAWSAENLGGTLASGPDMASPEPGRFDVFAAASDPVLGIWRRTFREGVGWAGWEHIGAEIIGGPGAVSWGPGRIDVVGLSPKGGISHYWWQP